MTPRPYQLEAIARVKESCFEEGINNLLIQKPTGAGKTVFFSLLPDAINIGERRVLVLAHREELVEQAAAKLKVWNPDKSVGIEMGVHRAGDAQIVVASVQTIGRTGSIRLEQFDPETFGLIVVDETHHSVATSYGNVLDYFRVKERKDILHVGVTATTKRFDGKGLGKIYDKIAYQLSIHDAIEDGWLVDLVGKKISSATSLDEVKASFWVVGHTEAIFEFGALFAHRVTVS